MFIAAWVFGLSLACLTDDDDKRKSPPKKFAEKT